MSITSTLVHHADIRFHEAAVALRPYVGCFWVVTAEPDATLKVVPDGTTSIYVHLQEGRPAEWLLRGPLLRPDERRFAVPTVLVGVRMRPGVAFLLSGIPAHSIVGRRVSLEQCAAFRELVSVEASLQTPVRSIDVLQRFLIDRLANASVHGLVATALREIDRAHGCLRVEEVAARCGIGARHLNRLMRTWIGYSPKRYANVVRFQATLMQMEDSPGSSAAFLASDRGYFDQAHLTVDTARFAGSTPGRLASRSVADFSKTRCADPS